MIKRDIARWKKVARAVGIKSFYVPRSHPDGFSVNARCIDTGTIEAMTITPLNGREWEAQYPKGGENTGTREARKIPKL